METITFFPNIVRNSKQRNSYSINIDKNTRETLALERRFDDLSKINSKIPKNKRKTGIKVECMIRVLKEDELK